jgi:ubiquinone/menaquinone biosynthesis C-methylase UbiE
MNFFGSKTAAERYVKGRPDFHANTIARVKTFLEIDQKVPMALDVACGTGLSAKALLPIADEVYATDASPEMLNVAFAKDQVRYIVAPAENQPFEDGEFDLITVSSALHWFDIDAFLTEACRLLRTNGWLVIYENNFTGKMEGNDDFKRWVDEVYLGNFPTPPRNRNYDWSVENLQAKGFSMQVYDEFENEINFDRAQSISYFTTQSNVISAVENKRYTYDKAEQWLDGQLALYFDRDETVHTFLFVNRIKFLQKRNIDLNERY